MLPNEPPLQPPGKSPRGTHNGPSGRPWRRIERIVSTGHRSPDGFWYDQPEHEWVMVLQGAARLAFEDRVVEMVAGDSINIPARQKHRVEWTTPDQATVWLAVFFGG